MHKRINITLPEETIRLIDLAQSGLSPVPAEPA